MFIVVDIGCIECRSASGIVGVFTSKGRADELADKLQGSHDRSDGGQHRFEVFPVPEFDTVAPFYASPPPV